VGDGVGAGRGVVPVLEAVGRFVGQVGVPAALALVVLWRLDGALRDLAVEVRGVREAVVVLSEQCRGRVAGRMPGRAVRRGGGILRVGGQSGCLGEGERVGSVPLVGP